MSIETKGTRLTASELAILRTALWDYAHSSHHKTFKVAASILRKLGMVQSADAFEERGELFEGLKPATLAEVSKREPAPFQLRRAVRR